jgi:hypothetical protein
MQPTNIFPPLKLMQLLHRFLLTGQVIFTIVATGLVFTKQFSPTFSSPSSIQRLQTIAVVIMLLAIIVGQKLFTRKVDKAKQESAVQYKLNSYRTALLIQWAMLEGAQLLATILFLLSANAVLGGMAAFMIWLFIKKKPQKEHIVMHLELSAAEAEQL